MTAALAGATETSPTPVTVTVGAGTATPGTDFTASPTTFTLTIPENMANRTATFVLTPVDDDVDEGDGETVAVSGSAAGGPVVAAEVTIADDDERGMTVRVGGVVTTTVAVTETDANVFARYQVVLDTQPTAAVTVTPSVPGGTDVSVSGALTFTPTGSDRWDRAQTVTVTVAPDSDAVADEVAVSHTVAGGDYAGFAAPAVTVSVTDDEAPSTRVALSVSPESVNEDDATGTSITVTGTLNDGTRGTATAVTVSVGSGTATSGTDFTASPATFTLTIPANAPSGTATFTLTPTDDTLEEGIETLRVTGATTVGLSVTEAAMRIVDDEIRIGLSVAPASVGEGAGSRPVTVTATMLGAPETAPAVVTVTVSGGTATSGTDFAASPASFTLTIPGGAGTGTGTFFLTPVQDFTDEGDGETVSVTGTSSVGPVGRTAVTIADDDRTSTQVALSVRPQSVVEDHGARPIDVTAELNEAARTEAAVVTVTVTGGTATSGTDYAASPSTFTLTIAENTLSATAAFTLTPEADRLDEGDGETVRVTGTATAGLSVTEATVRIADDDWRAVVLVPPELTVTEGGQARYAIRLDSQPTGSVTVTPSLEGGGEVEVTVSGARTFTTGNWNTLQTVTVTAADDDVGRQHMDLRVRHGVSGADYAGLTAPVLALRLLDNDGPAVVSVEMESRPGGQQTYRRGETIEVRITFDADLAEVTGPAAMALELEFDDSEQDASRRVASWRRRDGARALVFGYTVLAGDFDRDGLKVAVLRLGTASLRDAEDRVASPALPAQAAREGHRVDGGLQRISVHPEGRAAGGAVTEGTYVRFRLRRTGTTATRLAGGLNQSDSGASGSGIAFLFMPGEAEIAMTHFVPDDGVPTVSRVVRVWVRGEASEDRLGLGYLAGVPASMNLTIRDRSEGGNTSGNVTILGSPRVGGRLEARVGAVGDPDGVAHAGFEWQWFADGTPIRGATDPEYRPVASDAGKRLSVQVSYVDDAGQRESANSDQTVIVQPAKDPPAVKPAPPRTLDASPGDRSVVLSWTAPDGDDGGGQATGYEYRSAEGDGEWGDWTAIDSAGAAGGTHRVRGLGNGTGYRFEVRAVNAYGESLPSPEASATPGVPTSGGICGRTPQVRDFIVVMLQILHGHASVDCAGVTAEMLAKMTWIELARESIVELDARDFAGLTQLRELTLLYNGLRTLPSRVFDGLSALEELDLSGNALHSLPAGLFDDLRNLRVLSLLKNRLETFPFDELEALPHLSVLSITGNPGHRERLEIAPRQVTVTPGGSATYRLRLTSAPTAGDLAVTLVADGQGIEAAPAELVFNRRNWFRSRTVEVTAGASASGESALSHVYGEAFYSVLPPSDVTVRVRVLRTARARSVDPPRVSGAAVTTGPGANGVWDAGETIAAEIRFSAPVTVDAAQGTPALALTLDGERRAASLTGGSGTRVLRFAWRLADEDAGASTVRVVPNGLALNGATIRGADDVNAELGFDLVPSVRGVEVVPDGSGDLVWSAGETVEARLSFSEAVTVDTAQGTPSLGVSVAGEAGPLDYASGTGRRDPGVLPGGDRQRRRPLADRGAGGQPRAEWSRHRLGGVGAGGGARPCRHRADGRARGDAARTAVARRGGCPGDGGLGRDDGLRGDPRTRVGGDGDGGLRDLGRLLRRRGDAGLGLHRHLRHADLRPGRDCEDGVGAGAGRRPRRGRGDVHAHPLQPRRRRCVARRRGRDRHHREHGHDSAGVARALRAHGGRAGARGGRGAFRGGSPPRGHGERRGPGPRWRIGRRARRRRDPRGGEAPSGAVEVVPGRDGRAGCRGAGRLARADAPRRRDRGRRSP